MSGPPHRLLGPLRGPDDLAAPDLVQDRKDAMAALSRAVERRIQLFRGVYGIDRLPGMGTGRP